MILIVFLMLKNTNNINYIQSTGSLVLQVSGVYIQVEMDLISHDSTRDITTRTFQVTTPIHGKPKIRSFLVTLVQNYIIHSIENVFRFAIYACIY